MGQDRSQQSPERARFVEDLLGYMTCAEKVGQLVLLPAAPDPHSAADRRTEEVFFDRLRKGSISAITGVTRAAQVEALQRIAIEESRLGIPLLIAAETANGCETIMPIAVSAAASWDEDAIEASERVIAAEARTSGIRWALSPQARLSPWLAETGFAQSSGETPLLGHRIALARIRGLQGDWRADATGVMACLSLPPGGWPRGRLAAERGTEQVSDELAVILAAMEAGVGSLAIDPRAQDRIERLGEAGDPFAWVSRPGEFPGIVLAEWSELARLAGQDRTSPPYFGLSVERVVAAVQNGRIPPVRLDEAVRRVLGMKYDLGLFRDSLVPDANREREAILPSPETRRKVALDLARRSIVLLRNSQDLLPLDPNFGSVLIVGGAANDSALPLAGRAGKAVTLIEGLERLRQAFKVVPGLALRQNGQAANFRMVDADRMAIGMASEAARRAGTVVLALGETPDGPLAGELGEAQHQLLQALLAANPRVVLVTLGERPLDPDVDGSPLPAVVHAGQLGTMSGQAIAEVLTGAFAPTGALPYALQSRVAERALPLGHGLTYTDFMLRDVTVELGDDCLVACAQLLNIGEREGAANVQLYLRRDCGAAPMERPALRDFRRIALAPGEVTRVDFQLRGEALGYFAADGRYRVEPGQYFVRMGIDAENAEGVLVQISPAVATIIAAGGQPRGPMRALTLPR